MACFIALLRAVNVGGTGKLPMSDLKSMCESAGFKAVRTYIASGNVVFESNKSEQQAKAALERRLFDYAGKQVGVLVRTASELAGVLERNPFSEAAANRTVAIFLNEPPPPDALEKLTGQKDEELRLGKREIYVHYGNGMGHSKQDSCRQRGNGSQFEHGGKARRDGHKILMPAFTASLKACGASVTLTPPAAPVRRAGRRAARCRA